MKYCIAAADRFEQIPDPYNNGRICFKSKNTFFDRTDLTGIMNDPKFLFIVHDIVYFNT